MREAHVTPAQLREDAERLSDLADSLSVEEGEDVALPFRRAAAALERWAEALEQGERVCRWIVLHTPQGVRLAARGTSCGKWRSLSPSVPIHCPYCGGRVVLGDEEASDE